MPPQLAKDFLGRTREIFLKRGEEAAVAFYDGNDDGEEEEDDEVGTVGSHSASLMELLEIEEADHYSIVNANSDIFDSMVQKIDVLLESWLK